MRSNLKDIKWKYVGRKGIIKYYSLAWFYYLYFYLTKIMDDIKIRKLINNAVTGVSIKSK